MGSGSKILSALEIIQLDSWAFDNYRALNSIEKNNEADGMDDFDRHDWNSETNRVANWEKDNISVGPFEQTNSKGERKSWH